jgi:citrate synthase
MEIWFDDDLKDARFQGFFEVARSVGWLARLWITLSGKVLLRANFLTLTTHS